MNGAKVGGGGGGGGGGMEGESNGRWEHVVRVWSGEKTAKSFCNTVQCPLLEKAPRGGNL